MIRASVASEAAEVVPTEEGDVLGYESDGEVEELTLAGGEGYLLFREGEGAASVWLPETGWYYLTLSGFEGESGDQLRGYLGSLLDEVLAEQ